MSIRFLLGRAGSGKTHACLEAIRLRLACDPLRGPKLVLLVPEQASLQMERALLAPPLRGVSSRAEVLSFRRLAHRVLESTGVPPRRTLSEATRAMVLRHLLERHRSELRYYRGAQRLIGLTRELGATIGELLDEGVDAADLGDGPTEQAPTGGIHEAKLHDVGLLLKAYLDYLGDERLDPSQHLDLAREALSRCTWLAGAEVWVDGFATMSGREKRLLIELLRLSKEATLALLCDPLSAEGLSAAQAGLSATQAGLSAAQAGRGRAGEALPESRDLFAPTRETLWDWERLLRRAGLTLGPTITLDEEPPFRFRGSERLARLERALFRLSACSAQAGGPVSVPPSGDREPQEIEVAELPSPRLEVEYAVAAILRWVRDPGLSCRFRDIAVIVRDLERYHDLLAVALSARSIPFFLDRRRSIAHHPLVEFLRTMTEMRGDPYRLDVVRRLLKTGLTPLPQDEADELENYLVEHGIEGPVAWHVAAWHHLSRGEGRDDPEPDPYLERRREAADRARRALIGWLDPLIDPARHPSETTGEGWRGWLGDVLHQGRIGERLEAWAAEDERAGRLDEAEAHRQVLRDVNEFLDDTSFAFQNLSLDATTFGELLETGLATVTLGLAPPMIDQVLVSSIERSRHPNLRAAVILGFNEGVFPAIHAEGVILGDEDRARLEARGLRLGTSRRHRIRDERLLAYLALTRPGERLLVTYAASDTDGRALRPSPYLSELMPHLAGAEVKRVGDPREDRAAWDVHTTGDLIAAMAWEMRVRPALKSDDPVVRGRWNAGYERLRSRGQDEPRMRRAFEGLVSPPKDRLSAAVVARLRPRPLRTSVSALESFAACPFLHFAKQDLKLRERPDARLTAIDIGLLHHAVLEDFVTALNTSGRDLARLSEEDVERELAASLQRVSGRLDTALAQTTSRDAYLIRRSREHLRPMLRAQREALAAGSVRPRRTEAAFGVGAPGSLPPLKLSTPEGNTVLLRGFIDRVDLAEWSDQTLGVVVDYKSGALKLDLAEVYHGLSLQLLAYLCVLQEHGHTLAGRPIQPLAGLYVSLRPAYRTVDHPSQAAADPMPPGASRARGIIHFDRRTALEDTAGSPRYYQVRINKDGQAVDLDRNDAVSGEDFHGLLNLTRRRIGELADRLIGGGVEVEPRRLLNWSPCSWCEYPSVCGYEAGASPTVVLPHLKRKEVLEAIGTDKSPSSR